jgi:hypothetical protein
VEFHHQCAVPDQQAPDGKGRIRFPWHPPASYHGITISFWAVKFIKNSIGLKIFSVVILIVIVMVGVSVVNVKLESRVGQALDRVSIRGQQL